MAILFTSDTHFGHAGARALYGRPFATVAEMDEALVTRWNEAVAPGDTVWHLGDFAIGQTARRTAELLARLNGTKHLVTGNNDPETTTAQPGWGTVLPYAEMVLEGTGLVLCHYAFRSWRNSTRGWWNLHGHSHGALTPLPHQADAGVDAWEFRPIPLASLLARRQRRVSGRTAWASDAALGAGEGSALPRPLPPGN